MTWLNLGGTDNVLTSTWSVPVGVILTSFGFWECFVEEESPVPLVRWMWGIKDRMVQKTR